MCIAQSHYIISFVSMSFHADCVLRMLRISAFFVFIVFDLCLFLTAGERRVRECAERKQKLGNVNRTCSPHYFVDAFDSYFFFVLMQF